MMKVVNFVTVTNLALSFRETSSCQITRISISTYEGVFKSFRTDRLERELQMIQLSTTRFSFILILWVSLVSFAATTLCVALQRVFVVVVVYFVIDSVRKLLDIPSYNFCCWKAAFNYQERAGKFYVTKILRHQINPACKGQCAETSHLVSSRENVQ
jgi:hypothetical protein